MKNIGTKIAAVAFVLIAATPAMAGKGGSAERIRDAVSSTSVDAITAEIERAESLMCPDCIPVVTNLLEDDRYAVREVAAWWFAKRPQLKDMMVPGFLEDLKNGNTIAVRNAADFLGRTMTYTSLPALREAIKRDVGAEGKLAMVRAVKYMGHQSGNPVLIHAMTDQSADVRAAAVAAYRDIRGQKDATPIVGMLADSSGAVRAEAATVAGAMRAAGAVAALENIVVNDADPVARRNAAWALGRIGSPTSRDALTKATLDKSSIVHGVAKAALATLR
ncbi:MAG: HEAT repeat domain-containing protein [Kofleriaceae bacterium]